MMGKRACRRAHVVASICPIMQSVVVRKRGVLALVLAWVICAPLAECAPKKKELPGEKMSFIDNGTLKVGVNLALGGAITWVSKSGSKENVVNSHDLGRQIQMSYYSGPNPYIAGDKKPVAHWASLGWNPIQSGDYGMNPSKVLDHRNDKKSIYVKCIPMQWPHDGVPGECTFESWIRLEGPAAHVRSRINNARSDKTLYSARHQEMPAVYVNGPYCRLMTYTNAEPFMGRPLAEIVKGPDVKGPWASWTTTEFWAAQVNKRDWGLGVWQPATSHFIGGFAGRPGEGGPKDGPTGYIAPVRSEFLDHNIEHEFGYALILGTLREIRDWVYENGKASALPVYDFRKDRQGWYYKPEVDFGGWPLKEGLWVKTGEGGASLTGPRGAWRANDVPRLRARVASKGGGQATVFWGTLEKPGFGAERSVRFSVNGDGAFQDVGVVLSGHAEYKGIITGLRIDPPAGEWFKMLWLAHRPFGEGGPGGAEPAP